MKLSLVEQELVRTKPQQTRLYLSIFQPTVVMQCQVNNPSAARNDRVIPYDSVSLGAFTAVEAGMTLLVGTTPGARDVGRVRIRSVDSAQFIVSENSNINWQDNLYLTVLRYWELWPIYPRIINDPNNPENVIFYKDYDIAYSNQNSILGTFSCAGPHRAAFVGERIWYSSTGTYNLLGDSLSFDWAFEGGVPTGSTSADPGYVTYNTPGHYVTRLIVSGSSGGVDTTYRYVSIYDRPDAGSNPPVLKWTMGDLTGSRAEGGYRLPLKIFEPVQVNDNSVVVLFAEDWYGQTKQSLGGNYPNSASIVFVGFIEKDSIHYDYRQSSVEFDVLSLTGLMKETDAFSVSVQSVRSPSVWYELLDLNARRAIYHYLKWHTTVLSIADFSFIGDDRPIQYFDADRTSIFDAIDNFLRNTLIGAVVSDRQGKIWAEIDAQAYPNPTGSFPSVMSITKRDWMNEPSIEERLNNEVSYLELGGIAYSGVVTGTFTPLMANAPGDAPSFRGKPENREGLALLDQNQLNQLVGNVFANNNSRYPSISMTLSENFRNSDIAPQEGYAIQINPNDTVRNVSLDLLGIPADASWTYDAAHGILIPTITFNTLVTGLSGQTIIIPPVPPDNGFKVPGIQLPSLPELTIPSLLPSLVSASFPEMKRRNSAFYSFTNTPSTFFNRWANITTLLHSTPDANTTFVVNIGTGDITDPSFIRVLRDGIYRIVFTFQFELNNTANQAEIRVQHVPYAPGFPDEESYAVEWYNAYPAHPSVYYVRGSVEDVVHLPPNGWTRWLIYVYGNDAFGYLNDTTLDIQLVYPL